MNGSVTKFTQNKIVLLFHDHFPRNVYSDIQGPYLACFSSDLQLASFLLNFGCSAPFSGIEAKWQKTALVQLPDRKTISRLIVGHGP